MRRWLLAALAGAAGLAWPQARHVDAGQVEAVHRSALLIDTHNDIPMRTVEEFDIGRPSAATHTDLPRLRRGGVGAQFFAAYVAASYAREHRAAHRALEMIDTIRRDIVERHGRDFLLARTADDIEQARREGKIAALIGIEGGHAIEDNLRLLNVFYDLGARYLTLTHTNTNNWADSSGDQPRHNGLTPFGREVIRHLNRLGMIVDVSHVSDKTFWDALEASEAPIFASHSSCRALTNVPRNLSDDMIRALAKKGGVVQINFACDYLSQKAADAAAGYARERAALREKYGNDPEALTAALERLAAARRPALPRATLADVVAHIDHAVRIGGVDAVGLGSDFDGISCTPEGLDDVSRFPNLTRALLEKGYSPADIRKIYGENTLRLMRAVERTAARLRARPSP